MKASSKYLVAVALLAVLAVVFGLVGTVAPMSKQVSPQQESSDSVTHFMNPPTFDSGWVNITHKCGQYFNITHDLNTTDVFVDIVGKQTLSGTGGEHQRNLGGTDYRSGWSRTYGETNNDYPFSLVQTVDGGYAITGYTESFGAGGWDFWLVKTDGAGNPQWDKTYGGTSGDTVFSVVQTVDGGYAVAGCTGSFGAGSYDFWLVKTDVESGLAWTDSTNNTITLYRGRTNAYWNYVRVRIWQIKEPTWQFGDINQDGVVDAQDLLILSQNYGQTFSLLSLSGIIAVAGIHTYKKRKQPR